MLTNQLAQACTNEQTKRLFDSYNNKQGVFWYYILTNTMHLKKVY